MRGGGLTLDLTSRREGREVQRQRAGAAPDVQHGVRRPQPCLHHGDLPLEGLRVVDRLAGVVVGDPVPERRVGGHLAPPASGLTLFRAHARAPRRRPPAARRHQSPPPNASSAVSSALIIAAASVPDAAAKIAPCMRDARSPAA